jgi:hypothetical protein
MLVTLQDILFLGKLSTTNDLVAIDTIPAAFKQDFQLYFFGKTLTKKDDLLFAYPHDIKLWLQFLFDKYNG